ncbi:MAG: hypothetical protein AAF611_02920 [Bacteroidota bacterium]
MKKLFLKLFLLTIIVFAVLQLGNKLFKSHDGSVKTWQQFYENDTPKYDVIISGNSIAYSSYNPKIINSKSSLNTFNLSSSSIGIEQVYYNFKEVIKYNKPQLFIVEAHALDVTTTNVGKRLKFNYQNIDGQKLSLNKLSSIYHVFESKSTMMEAIFPVVRNHNKWSDFEFIKKNTDYTYTFDQKLGYRTLSIKGYKERISKTIGKMPKSYEIPEENIGFLKKIVDLCNENDIKFLLVRAPQIKYQSDPKLVSQIYEKTTQLCEELAIVYLDQNNDYNKLGFKESEFYDALHLNTVGATKATELLSEAINQNFTLTKNENIVHKDPNQYADDDNYKKFKGLIDQPFTPVEGIIIDQVYVKYFEDGTYSFYVCFDTKSNTETISKYKLALQFFPEKEDIASLKNATERKKGRISFGALSEPYLTNSEHHIRVIDQKKLDLSKFRSFVLYLYNSEKVSEKIVSRNVNLK